MITGRWIQLLSNWHLSSYKKLHKTQKLPLLQCYHTFSNTRGMDLHENQYELLPPQDDTDDHFLGLYLMDYFFCSWLLLTLMVLHVAFPSTRASAYLQSMLPWLLILRLLLLVFPSPQVVSPFVVALLALPPSALTSSWRELWNPKALALSTSIRHACDWLNVVPSLSLGLRMFYQEFESDFVCNTDWASPSSL